MTNTLHRFGKAESFVDDFVVIGIPAKGKNKGADPLPALRRFLEIALEYNPVNIGDAMSGGAVRPTNHKWWFEHFFHERPDGPDFKKVLETITKPTTFSVVFDNADAAKAFVIRLKEEDLGLSINISSSIENALACCQAAGLKRHSVGYSLGFEGIPDNVPNRHVLMLSTMCGHGMVSQAFAKKMIDWVKEDRATPDEAIAAMSRFCSCGIFNPARAKRIIEDARGKTF
jgi:hypothetical protein